MDAVATRAVEIADRHLKGAPPARRLALAKEIVQAIHDYAHTVAVEAIRDTSSAMNKKH